jgi:hypothetical protein
LGGNGEYPGSFEFGQAGCENALGRTELFNQFLDAGWTQPRRQGQREPVDAMVRSRVEGGNRHVGTANFNIIRHIA